MKTYVKLLIVCATILGMTSIVGCNNSQETSDISNPTGSVTKEVSDADVTSNVTTALQSDEELKNFNIAVITLKGDVRLTGTVDNQDYLYSVEKLVRSIEGVHSIHDELTIKK
ncbi:MAG: BON domain-containing protein [Methylophilaceae bacterium]